VVQHTGADTMEPLDPAQMDRAVAVWALHAFVVADLSIDFPRDGPVATR
jgi:hypothetical protein